MGNLCIIPARGGSKRIPRKNIKEFLGKPIIAYSIEAAIECQIFDEIMVSTDDEEIAEVALKYGARIPFLRSKTNSSDTATTFHVIEEVVSSYEDLGADFKYACCIYPCAPLIQPRKLVEAYRLLEEKKFDSVVPIVPFSFPVQRSLSLKDGFLAFTHPKYATVRSQDLEKAYHDSGQFYWFAVDRIMAAKSMLTANTGAITLDEMQVQDIDNLVDWKLTELKFKLVRGL